MVFADTLNFLPQSLSFLEFLSSKRKSGFGRLRSLSLSLCLSLSTRASILLVHRNDCKEFFFTSDVDFNLLQRTVPFCLEEKLSFQVGLCLKSREESKVLH